MISLGDKVRCRLTGVTGIATCKQEWLYGCNRWVIQPELEEGKQTPPEQLAFDEPQLEVLEKSVVKQDDHSTGGTKPAMLNTKPI